MLKFSEHPLHPDNAGELPEGSTYVIAAADTTSIGIALYLCEGSAGWFYITVKTVEKHSNDLLRPFWQHIPGITKKEDAIEFVKVLFRMGEV